MHPSQDRMLRALHPIIHPQGPVRRAAVMTLLCVAALPGCHGNNAAPAAAGETSMELTTSSFHDGRIPPEFTCDGADRSPQLAWTAPPAATKSLTLIVTDPDAPGGTFVHWVLYNLPTTLTELYTGVPTQAQLSDGSRQGRNDFGRTGYGGPCPPSHSTHRYIFDLYALDISLSLQPGATRQQVESAIKGHIQAHAQLIGRYGR